jgi:putative ABC transport system ATP-binding protein
MFAGVPVSHPQICTQTFHLYSEELNVSNTTLIRLENLYKEYPLGKTLVPALHDVSLNIQSGDFAAFAGPSGSGKSTLLNIIGCIDKATQGTVILDGQNITNVPLHRLAATRAGLLGFIFQSFNLLPVLTAFENVEYPLLFSGLSKRQRYEKVSKWLHIVGLSDHARHKPDQLSGGQRQRVAIARAMVAEPALVLADEPTASLDSATAEDILDLLRELNGQTGVTFVFATHDPRVMERAARVIVLQDGRIHSDTCVSKAERRCIAC